MDTGGKGKVPITLGLLGNITQVHKACLTYIDAYTTPLSLAMAISKYKQSAAPCHGYGYKRKFKLSIQEEVK